MPNKNFVIKYLRYLAEQLEKGEIELENHVLDTETKEVGHPGLEYMRHAHTGQFSFTVYLYSEELNNYQETVDEVHGNRGEEGS